LTLSYTNFIVLRIYADTLADSVFVWTLSCSS